MYTEMNGLKKIDPYVSNNNNNNNNHHNDPTYGYRKDIHVQRIITHD